MWVPSCHVSLVGACQVASVHRMWAGGSESLATSVCDFHTLAWESGQRVRGTRRIVDQLWQPVRGPGGKAGD